VADRFQLDQVVRPREQPQAALEQIPQEIRAQPVAQNGEAQAVGEVHCAYPVWNGRSIIFAAYTEFKKLNISVSQCSVRGHDPLAGNQ
jgi:hypothetical protein